MSKQGWIGVDLDGTLAYYEGWHDGKIGHPVSTMADRVRQWLSEGKDVRIFTARVAGLYLAGATDSVREEAGIEKHRVQIWTLEHFGVKLPVTAVKDFALVELWDDRAVQVEPNTGRRMDGSE